MPLQANEEPASEKWIFSRQPYNRAFRIHHFFLLLAVIAPCNSGIEGLFISVPMILIAFFTWRTMGNSGCGVSFFPDNEVIRIEKGKRRIEVHLEDVVSVWQGNRVFYEDQYAMDYRKYHTPFAITLRRSTIFGKEISFTVFEENPADMENVRKFRDKVILKRHAQAMIYGKRVREEQGR